MGGSPMEYFEKVAVSALVRASTKDLGRDISNSLYLLKEPTPQALREHLMQRGVSVELADKWATWLDNQLATTRQTNPPGSMLKRGVIAFLIIVSLKGL